ncbi:MAG: hypothetical protein IJM15_00070 [Erysipelotrichaceae bacterium]|nr:hypothetical protein [Erysipelotrichaceae bacterium]
MVRKSSRRKSRLNRRTFFLLASLVVFITTYALVLPAITLDRRTALDQAGINQENETVIDNDDLLNDAEKQTKELLYFYDESTDVTVSVEAPYNAFPKGTVMVVRPVKEEEVIDAVNSTVNGVRNVQAIDITFYYKGTEIEPAVPIKVSLISSIIKDALSSAVVHIDGDGEAEVVRNADSSADSEIVFAADDFSTYVIVEKEITIQYITADGETYTITVGYDQDALIPEGAILQVEEINGTDEQYSSYYSSIKKELGYELEFIRLFDISIVADGQKIQPQATVSVSIELNDLPQNQQALNAVHFGSDGDVQVMNAETSDNTVSFNTNGFSVYGVVTVEPLPAAMSISDLDGQSFYVSIDRDGGRYYFTNTINNNLIRKTNPFEISSASLYSFEKVEGTENQFYISTTNSNGNKIYVRLTDGSESFSFSATEKVAFVVEEHNEENTFLIYYRRSNGSKRTWTYTNNGFSGKVKNKDALNMIRLTCAFDSDPYGLDGKEYGIIFNNDTVTGTALTTTATGNGTKIAGQTLIVRTEPVKRTENVFVAEGSTITMWKFHAVSGDKYYLTAEVDSTMKYLRIANEGVSLVDASAVDDNCLITIEPGIEKFYGKYKFSSNGKALRLSGSDFTVINDLTTNPKEGSVWMNLAELSNLKDNDFVTYTATKVSVSGVQNPDGTISYDVEDGDYIIVYTRIWNNETKRYEYYTIDYDGLLVRAYESGDSISWVGTKVNTMLWQFTEYHYDDGTPNYYYELQNLYSGKYIAPQVSAEDFLSDDTIGINLNGRRNLQYYTTILAWDDPYYDYASLKVQDWKLVSAPINRADTFYFAIMKPKQEQQPLTTVATLDHTPFGITLKMRDYEDINTSINRSREQLNVLGNTTYNQWTGTADMLAKNLSENGYPMVMVEGYTNHSLSELYSGAMEVNQQFLMSTYQETGYFEYDSTQNFAHLITSTDDYWYGRETPTGGIYGIGDFVVYEQLGTSGEPGKDTLKHGQFLPYNDLMVYNKATGEWEPRQYSEVYYNERDIHANPLSSLDPRKGERLYNIPWEKGKTAPEKVDHFFGMEMEAKFMQSESGLDAWGHDLIFEFSGDDDFWLYIDDMLVLDLGGIHSALDGDINFRTGVVRTYKGKNGEVQTTNLRELYKAAYQQKNPDAEEEEVEQWLDGIFKENDDGVKTVFKNYSGHSMKMFYMERGAGASNLHMRFNLAPYNNGEVLLEKEVSGVEKVDSSMIFPFQIMYRDSDDNSILYANGNSSVTDVLTGDPLPYFEQYTVNGVTYNDVFILEPGQTASIKLPSENTKYIIKECGINARIYDEVTINEVHNDGTPTSQEGIMDYQTAETTVVSCKKVIYNNHVDNEAIQSLLITKNLWQDFAKIHPISAEDDPTGFKFRIYLGKKDGSYVIYNTGKYYVRDPEGYYCIYNNGFQSTGIDVFDDLSDEIPEGAWKSQKELATFYTSPGGAIDKIPAGYTIEIPGLMEGTAFFIEERDDEIPTGYNLIDYTCDDPEEEIANQGTVSLDNESHVYVNNQHGYGLSVEKVWSDAPFMEDHDEIYFAVFILDENGEYQVSENDQILKLRLIDDSIRQLGRKATALNWFMPELESGKTLNDYLTFEVTLSEGLFTVSDGIVTLQEGCTVTPIADKQILSVGGNSNEHGYSASFEYTSSYLREYLTAEQISQNVNSRKDTVDNDRPGIKLVKTDLEGAPLEGGVFTLMRSPNGDDEHLSTMKTFTSGEDGLIAVAYLMANQDYILTEIRSPFGYITLIDPLTIRVDENNHIYINGTDSSGDYYQITQVENPTVDNMPTIEVRNMPFSLKAVKVDATDNSRTIQGVEFELYREVTDYNTGYPMPDYTPMSGFEQLITDENGVIPKINLQYLTQGAYYLREKRTLTSYQSLDYDIYLKIDESGNVTIQKATYEKVTEGNTEYHRWIIRDFDDPLKEPVIIRENDGGSGIGGDLIISIRNSPTNILRIWKQDAADKQLRPLAGVEFKLYKQVQIENNQPKEGEEPIASGITDENGYLNLISLEEYSTYYLFETATLDGYIPLSGPIVITNMKDGHIYATYNNHDVTITNSNDENGVVISTMVVYNSSGICLPYTGGEGKAGYYLAGIMMLMIAVISEISLRRKRKGGT